MAYGTIKQLVNTTLHATESIVYTAPTSKSVEIGSIWMHNPTTSHQTATMWFPFTATQATGIFISSLTIQRLNEVISSSVSFEVAPKVPWVLNSSGTNYVDKITMKCTQTGSINVLIYGRVEV